ncbi:MAG: hypothetical protein QG565_29 [Campylobacterota bacterium]|nr:hypothetical protein [Campylobacterota bacterium]
MTHTLCLDEKYSTTRLLIQEKPEIINSAEDKFETVLFLPDVEGRKGEGGLRTKGYFKKSYENKPLISIITVVFNGEKYLEETIESVINQTYDNVEYIIVDGGSTDGTLDIIKKYEDMIDYWVSEKDGGIYDAMNKGIDVASGKIIGIINADDYYASDDIFKKLVKFIDKEVNIYFGNMVIINQDSKQILEKRIPNQKKLYFGMYLNHPSTFVAKETYKKIGKFNSQDFKMAADYDFILRNKVKGSKFLYINEVMTYMRDGGTSISNISLTMKETYQARKNNLSCLILFITNLIKIIRKITR